MLDQLSPQAQIGLGALLLLVGASFVYKAFLAIVKGRMTYWEGFLPFAIVSPFLLHLPAGKRSLVKETEGSAVQLVMGPVFALAAVVCLTVGADLSNLPGTATVNWVLSCGHAGQQAIVFDRHRGYQFPILVRACPVLAKLFNTQAPLRQDQKIVPDETGPFPH